MEDQPNQDEGTGKVVQSEEENWRPVAPFPLPPDDFIPLLSDKKTLRSYGFPLQPNKLTHPRQLSLWYRALSVPMCVLPAASNTLAAPIHSNIVPLPTGPTFGNSGYSASVHQSLPGCINVVASWVVPSIKPPPSPVGFGVWSVTSCVQLDGFFFAGTVTNGNFVDPDRKDFEQLAHSFAAWIDPAGKFPYSTFLGPPVSPGQEVNCAICAAFSTLYGTVIFLNKTTGQSTTRLMQAPTASAALTRNGASWGLVNGSNSAKIEIETRPLPTFGHFTFTDCLAANKTQEVGVEGGNVSDLYQNGVVVAKTKVLSSETFMVVQN